MFLLLAACTLDGTLVVKDDDPGFETAAETDSPALETAVETQETDLSAPEIDVAPTWLPYAFTPVGSTATLAFLVSNLGDAPLVVSGIVVESGPFTLQTSDGGPLARELEPAGAYEVLVTYEPATNEGASSLVRVASDDADEPSVPVEVSAPGCEEGPPFVDEVLVAPSPTEGVLMVATSDGAGGFGAPWALDPPAGEAVDGPVVADFDGDGGWEIVARGVSGALYRYRWDTCDEAWVLEDAGTTALVPAGAADLDGDGLLDLFGTDVAVEHGCVARGDGLGGFTQDCAAFDPSASYTGYGHALSYHPADLDGDGALDLAVAAYDSPGEDQAELWWFPGRGDGTFDAPVRGPTAPGAVNGVDLGDVDGDGFVDLVGGGDDDGDAGVVWLVRGAGAGLGSMAEAILDLYPSEESGTNSPGASRGRLWDWNGDGVLDLALALETDPYDAASHEVPVLLGDGTGGYAPGGRAMDPGVMRGYALAVPAL